MAHQKLHIVREGVLAALIGFSVIVLGVSAHYISLTLNSALSVDEIPVWPQSSPDSFSVFSLAVAMLTLLTVPVMLLIDRLRDGAITSLIVVELSWLGTLCLLWLASASLTVSNTKFLLFLCSLPGNGSVHSLRTGCKDTRVAAAFSHLAWVSLFAYLLGLFILSFKSAQRGKPVWRQTVANTNFTIDMPQVYNMATKALGENGAQNNDATKELPTVMAQQSLAYSYLAQTQQGGVQQYGIPQQVQPGQVPQAPLQPGAQVSFAQSQVPPLPGVQTSYVQQQLSLQPGGQLQYPPPPTQPHTLQAMPQPQFQSVQVQQGSPVGQPQPIRPEQPQPLYSGAEV